MVVKGEADGIHLICCRKSTKIIATGRIDLRVNQRSDIKVRGDVERDNGAGGNACRTWGNVGDFEIRVSAL